MHDVHTIELRKGKLKARSALRTFHQHNSKENTDILNCFKCQYRICVKQDYCFATLPTNAIFGLDRHTYK